MTGDFFSRPRPSPAKSCQVWFLFDYFWETVHEHTQNITVTVFIFQTCYLTVTWHLQLQFFLKKKNCLLEVGYSYNYSFETPRITIAEVMARMVQREPTERVIILNLIEKRKKVDRESCEKRGRGETETYEKRERREWEIHVRRESKERDMWEWSKERRERDMWSRWRWEGPDRYSLTDTLPCVLLNVHTASLRTETERADKRQRKERNMSREKRMSRQDKERQKKQRHTRRDEKRRRHLRR